LHDGLTGLANRALFHDRIEQALHRARRSNAWPVVLYVDLDRFKSVNDRHGHASGDELLREAAARFLTAVRTGDTVARLGGDEFAILLEGGRPGDEAEAVAERLLATLTAPFFLDGQRLRVSASVGMAVADAGSTVSAVVRDADIAMYAAKADGKARVCVFDAAMRSAAIERARLENDLDEAIERGQFRVAYQPVIDLATRRFAGFEALLRWDHPTLGTLNPTDFVPVAEESDLIVKLGSYVLANAVREAVRWQKELPRPDNPVFVGVNVSSRQLFRPELIKEVRHILGRAVIPKGSLRLEITESLVMENPEKATAVMRQLADAGAGLALDDFGTGYSSLSYLNQFTFDTIKIDRSFLHASG
jgi:diguanylate cyclase (GGDEF)-like protein